MIWYEKGPFTVFDVETTGRACGEEVRAKWWEHDVIDG